MRNVIFFTCILALSGCAPSAENKEQNLVLTSAEAAKFDGGLIILGSAISFTGKYSTNGIHAKNGYNLGVKRINEMGGVKVGGKSYKLKIKYYDDESRRAEATQMAERLIKQDGVKFMLGPYSSILTKAVSQVTEKYKVPLVDAEASARSVFTRGYRYLFGVISTSEQYLASAIDLAAELARKTGRKPSDIRVAMAFGNDPFSRDVRAGVVDAASKYGMKIVIDDTLPLYPSNSDMAETLTKVRAVKPDILVVSAHTRGAVTAARQIKELNVQVPLIAITHCEAGRIIKRFGKATEGLLCPTQWAATLKYSGYYFGSAADYAKLFKATYRGYYFVPYQAAAASAAVLVWKQAFERAGSFDVEKVRAALAATEMQTFYGNIKFDESGKNAMKPMVLRQIQNGKLIVVAPTKWAPAKTIYPRRAAASS